VAAAAITIWLIAAEAISVWANVVEPLLMTEGHAAAVAMLRAAIALAYLPALALAVQHHGLVGGGAVTLATMLLLKACQFLRLHRGHLLNRPAADLLLHPEDSPNVTPASHNIRDFWHQGGSGRADHPASRRSPRRRLPRTSDLAQHHPLAAAQPCRRPATLPRRRYGLRYRHHGRAPGTAGHTVIAIDFAESRAARLGRCGTLADAEIISNEG
jgi:hypothetical protein